MTIVTKTNNNKQTTTKSLDAKVEQIVHLINQTPRPF